MSDRYEQILGYLADEENRVRPGPGKFEGCHDRRVAEALYEMIGDGASDDETGDVSVCGYYALIGRLVTYEDDQGFFTYADHETDADARKDFDRIASEYPSEDESFEE